jgi:hypothetical protein
MAANTRPSKAAWIRPSAGGGLALVVLSALLSALAYGQLGETLRIRWAVGTYYGPEYAPTLVVLGVCTILVAALYVATAVVGRYLDGHGFDPEQLVYEAGVLVLLGTVLFVQVLLIGFNLAF